MCPLLHAAEFVHLLSVPEGFTCGDGLSFSLSPCCPMTHRHTLHIMGWSVSSKSGQTHLRVVQAEQMGSKWGKASVSVLDTENC